MVETDYLVKVERNYDFKGLERTLKFLSFLSEFGSEQAQLFGEFNLYLPNIEIIQFKGPFVWAFTHDSRKDVVTGATLYSELPQAPFPAKVLARYDPFQNSVVDKAVRSAFSGYAHFLYRVGMSFEYKELQKSDLSSKIRESLERKLAEKREHNQGIFEQVWSEYKQGIHSIIAVEGTSKSTGRLTTKSVKSGVYRLVVKPCVDGPWAEVMPVIPVSITVDFMSNSQGKEIPCYSLGTPFLHEHVGHRDIGWQDEDKTNFLEGLRYKLAKQIVVTMSHLAGEYMYRSTIAKSRSDRSVIVSKRTLRKVVECRIDELGYAGQVIIEEKTKQMSTRNERFEAFVENLHKAGYVSSDGDAMVVNVDRMLGRPVNSSTMKDLTLDGNPLLFMVNRVYSLCDVRKDVKNVFRKTRLRF